MKRANLVTILLICGVLLGASLPASCQLDLFVNADCGDDANDGSEVAPLKTITHALSISENSTSTPTTIYISAGVYSASANGEPFPLIVGSWIHLVGEGADRTILDAEMEYQHIIIFSFSEGSTIEGFTMTGAESSHQGASFGGAILCFGGSPTIRNNEINGNRSINAGAAIYCSNKCSPLIADNEIHHNAAISEGIGGGIYCNDCTPTFSSNSVEGNSAHIGGGIYCENCVLSAERNLIAGNTAFLGGGIYCNDSSISLLDNEISGNNAAEGGGVFARSCTTSVSNNTIAGNQAGNGGGLCVKSCMATILNNLIIGNQAGYGGAVYSVYSESSMYNCLVMDNRINAWMTGAIQGVGADVLVFDSILWRNMKDTQGCSVTYCCVSDDTSGEGNIHTEPEFVEFPPVGGYYLPPNSPLLGAGSRSAEAAGLTGRTTQLDGLPDAGVVDIGYHYEIEDYRGPEISLETDRVRYMPGDTVTLTASSENPGEDTYIDLYVGLYDAEGDIHLFNQNGWASDSTEALIESIHIEAGLDLDAITLDVIELPADMPPINIPGRYSFFAFLSRPGTLELLGRCSYARFTVGELSHSEYYVNSAHGDDSGDGSSELPLKTISRALALSISDPTNSTRIHVSSGTYSTIANGETYPLMMKSYISLIGAGAEKTVLDGGKVAAPPASHIVEFHGVESAALSGFSITGAIGSAIVCEGSSPIISSNVIQGNYAEGDACGGAISCIDGGSATIRENLITNNSAFQGGAIFCQSSSPLITGNEINLNQCEMGGGAILCIEDSSPTISTNTISGNSTGQAEGGGISCRSSSSPLIIHNVLEGNSAEYGGGIACTGGAGPSIKNNLIVANAAESNGLGGGGIACEGTGSSINSNTIADNIATAGGGIYCLEEGLTISDCILWGNGEDLCRCSAVYSCIESEWCDGKGVIHSDPEFVRGPLGSFYLDYGSPCKDAGSMSARAAGLADLTTSPDGSPDAGRLDLGYHYAVDTTPPPGVTITANAEHYIFGRAVEVRLTVENHWDNMRLDLYVAFQGPDGADWFLGQSGWSEEFRPLYSDIDVPIPFLLEYATISTFEIPSEMPPVGEDGLYCLSAGLTYPGTLNLACPIGRAEFVLGDLFVDAVNGRDENPGAETFPFKTITHALSVADASETAPTEIHIASGLYSPDLDGETFPLRMRSFISLVGESSETAILNAMRSSTYVIRCESARDLLIEGLAITGAAFDWVENGCGIYCNNSQLVIRDNIISGNEGRSGGGLLLIGGEPIVEGNIIALNSAERDGAGILCNGSDAQIFGNTIVYNTLQGICGAAIYCNHCSPTIMDNLIVGNRGGTGGHGGGVCCSDGSYPTIANNILIGNEASRAGGAIFCFGNSEPDIYNNTILDNSATFGGGIHHENPGLLTVRDCILWGNGEELLNCLGQYCCIDEMALGEGNFYDDPMLVSGPAGEYFLAPASPCVDAGSRSALEAGLSDTTTQMDGTPDTGAVDVGYHHPLPQP
ncbi:MAG: DUF1565 domain-containing protein [Candidatus Coatesbacteria bacterium]|nr:DUF1565 domain-containing protein [Candidatus Coatesbacteria bacterium]